MSEKCRNCRYSKGPVREGLNSKNEIPGLLFCRRNPPERRENEHWHYSIRDYDHPVVHVDEWCGEYKNSKQK